MGIAKWLLRKDEPIEAEPHRHDWLSLDYPENRYEPYYICRTCGAAR